MQSDSDQSKPISICTYQTVFFLFYIVLSKAHRSHIELISRQLAINLASSCTLYILCIYPVILNHHVYTQKSGTAILLFRILRLWYCLKFQTTTLSPRHMYIVHAHWRVYDYTQTWASCVAMFWNLCEFTRFQNAKTKRVRRFYLLCLFRKEQIKLCTLHKIGCKITAFFWIMQVCIAFCLKKDSYRHYVH